jgi:hypothetical protein
MKFYKGKYYKSYYYNIIIGKDLNAIYFDEHQIADKIYYDIVFFKNGYVHNPKNAIYFKGNKEFYLNDEIYGYENEFTKQSWRKFVKMQVFL